MPTAAPPNASKGAGTVMRVAPVGIALAGRPDAAYRLGAATARLTHGHPTAAVAAGAMAAMVAMLVSGADETDAIAAGLDLVRRDESDRGQTMRGIASGLLRRRLDPARADALGGGWTAESALAIGVAALLVGEFRKGVLAAVNHGGDSDTTGSIAGALLGARLGPDAIPRTWLAPLEGREELIELAARPSPPALDPGKFVWEEGDLVPIKPGEDEPEDGTAQAEGKGPEEPDDDKRC